MLRARNRKCFRHLVSRIYPSELRLYYSPLLCCETIQYKQKAYKKCQKRRTKDSRTSYIQSKSDCQRFLRRARLQFSQPHNLEQELERSHNKQWWKLVKTIKPLLFPLSDTMAISTTRLAKRLSCLPICLLPIPS